MEEMNMPEIYGFRVGSTTYEYDYEHLANKPPEIPTWGNGDSGKVLAVSSHGGMDWVRIPALPDPENESEGKVLMVVSDSGDNVPGWEYLIPSYSYSNDDGKALVVNGCSERLEWRKIPPVPESGDEGKVLVCDIDGNMAWDSILPDANESGLALVSGDSSGVYEWERILPEWDGSDDSGKVLSIDRYGELAWLPGATLPVYSSNDSGKVLTVSSSGALEWMPVGST